MFKELFVEDTKPFNQNEYKAAAEKWLKNKFGDKFDFIHKENLSDADKTYHCSEGGKQFSIAGRKYDTSGDDKADTVAYKILPAEEEDEKEEDF